MKKQQLTTTQNTNLILGKTKSLMSITKKLLEGKSKELTTHKDITIIGNLMWEKESREMNWYEAMEYAKNLKLGGYDNWRLPTIEELEDVVTLCGGEFAAYDDDYYFEKVHRNLENALYQKAYKVKGFSNPSHYWSSTTCTVNTLARHGSRHGYADHTIRAWYVLFNNAYQFNDNKSNSYCVRCVRARQ